MKFKTVVPTFYAHRARANKNASYAARQINLFSKQSNTTWSANQGRQNDFERTIA